MNDLTTQMSSFFFRGHCNFFFMLEEILNKPNMTEAYKRVVRNKGASGIDDMRTEELKAYLNSAWIFLKVEILEGDYEPSAVRGVEIPKPKGGKRQLGIPTVLDRLIQQAIAQHLSKLWEPEFDPNSYGFRPRRNTHQCVRQARSYLNEGKRYVVDIDLSKFFDRVNHDILVGLLGRKIKDKRVLTLIGKYLRAGIMRQGLITVNREGMPQGSPLSPLLSNIMLNELDKELRKRGLSFVRYADDFSIYVKSKKAATRVYEGVRKYLTKRHKLQINEEKSSCVPSTKFELLGFGFYANKEGYQIRVSKGSMQGLKTRLRHLTKGRYTISTTDRLKRINPLLKGWLHYFKIASCKGQLRWLDKWLRSRLRMCEWKLWKRVRTRYKKLKSLGFDHKRSISWACTRKGSWRVAHSPILTQSLSLQWLEEKGYESCLSIYESIYVNV